MKKLILYHGSSEIIECPTYGKGKLYNDYGRGFYCTEHIELAKEWACGEKISGYANCYQLNTERLRVLNLSSEEYSILHWLALLMEHRKIGRGTPLMTKGMEWLKDNFLIDVEGYDLIRGYRADDSYFSFARAFMKNEISLAQLSCAMKLGRLGEQVVLKSEQAFRQIQFLSYEVANYNEYYTKRKSRDDAAREAYFKEMENESLEGIYMRDILREEMKADDARIR